MGRPRVLAQHPKPESGNRSSQCKGGECRQRQRQDDAHRKLIAEERDPWDSGVLGQLRTDLVPVGPAISPSEQQALHSKSVPDGLCGDGDHEQGRQHFGHVAPIAKPGGQPCPTGPTGSTNDEHGHHDQRATHAELRGGEGGKGCTEEQLPLLADVDESGSRTDDGPERDEK